MELMRIFAENVADCMCCALFSATCVFGLSCLPFKIIFFAGVCSVVAWLVDLFVFALAVSLLFLLNLGINEGNKVCIWYRWKVVRFFLMLHWRVFSRLDESMKRYEEAREEEEEEDSAV